MTLSIAEIGRHEPFCAGVVLLRGDRMVMTLNNDHLPETPAGTPMVRLGGIGGGQEPGEHPAACAVREALEEVGIEVTLVDAPRTYLVADDAAPVLTDCPDRPAPVVVERRPSPHPEVPFRPGLPTGPHLYIVVYLAVGHAGRLKPSDVLGVVECPLARCHELLSEPTLAEVSGWPGAVVDAPGIAPQARLWTPPDETFRYVFPLMRDDPALADPAVRG